MRPVAPQIAPDERRRPKAADPASRARAAARKGPGPSKLSYRLARAWAKPMLRNVLLVYLPLVLLGLAGWRVAAHDALRVRVETAILGMVERLAARPEFAVRGVEVIGGSDALQREIRATLAIEQGMSSLTLDVEQLRRQIDALGAVETAAVQFDPQGSLRVSVVERIPVALYRRPDEVLVLLDRGGVEIGPTGPRADHPDLPVVLGTGAPERVGEALALLDAAPELLPRLRALVRVGERRWDIVLDRDMRIMLPAEGSIGALSRVMALHYGDELLDRDLAVIDMRLPKRPAVRMSPTAAETYQIRKAVAAIGGEET